MYRNHSQSGFSEMLLQLEFTLRTVLSDCMAATANMNVCLLESHEGHVSRGFVRIRDSCLLKCCMSFFGSESSTPTAVNNMVTYVCIGFSVNDQIGCPHRTKYSRRRLLLILLIFFIYFDWKQFSVVFQSMSYVYFQIVCSCISLMSLCECPYNKSEWIILIFSKNCIHLFTRRSSTISWSQWVRQPVGHSGFLLA